MTAKTTNQVADLYGVETKRINEDVRNNLDKFPEVYVFPLNRQEKDQQKALMRKSGEILMDVLSNDAIEVSGDETTLELNLAFMKIKHTVKRGKR